MPYFISTFIDLCLQYQVINAETKVSVQWTAEKMALKEDVIISLQIEIVFQYSHVLLRIERGYPSTRKIRDRHF